MEESTAIEVHIPCEDCGSSDAKCVYSDGHSYCYSCGTHHNGNKGVRVETKPVNFDPVEGKTTELRARKLTKETCEKWGYKVGEYNGQKVQVANYRRNGKLIGQKIRTKDKKFSWLGANKPGFYGQHLWNGGGKKLVITEGEIDAMSVSQAQDNKWPVVSLPHGAQNARKIFKDELDYLESFESVVLLFDMDEPGQKAAQECATLLTPGKVKIAQLPLKDANEMLKANRVGDLINCIWQAKEWTPAGIVNGNELWESVQKDVEMGLSYPFPSLTDAMYGIREGEVIVLGAGTGLGKTTVYKEIAYHLATEHKQKVGLLFLEEQNAMTALSMMSIAANEPMHLPGGTVTEAKKREYFDEVFGDGRYFMFDHFGSTSFEEIRMRIRYLVVSCGVKYVFLDHLAALTSGDTSLDERREVDYIMTHLAALVRELGFTLFLISHLSTPSSQSSSHEEGGRVTIKHFRGSRSIGQWANTLWALERNQQAENAKERHTSTFRILKDRYTGQAVGRKFKLYFNSKTNRLEEVADKVENPFDAPIVSDGGFEDF